jgi:hypothetical protein
MTTLGVQLLDGPRIRVPKDYRANLEWRGQLLKRAQSDLGFREKVRELYERDPIFAFNSFFWTYDPRRRPFHHQPFLTYGYEDQLILELKDSIEAGHDTVIDKSRDMGITWVVLELFEWFWSKRSGGYDFLVGSRIADYVDKKGDPRTHFERLRYNLYRLPKWLRPRGFDKGKHDNFMKLVNPETGSAITGESNNANFSTQGRYAGVFFDEFAKWEVTDEKAWTSAGDATPARIAGSTPFGAGGQFYKLAIGGESGVKKLRFHWSLHPTKSLGLSCVWPCPNDSDRVRMGEDFVPVEKLTSPWYEKECLRRTAAEIAQELDIDYIGAGNPVFDGRAMDSLKFYLGVKDAPVGFVRIDVEGLKGAVEAVAPFDPEGFLVLYALRNPAHRYAIGADVVEGVEGGDFAVAVVLNRMTKSVDGIYWSRMDEVGLARVVKVIADWYSSEPNGTDAPWTGIETTGPGLATFDQAVGLGMTNLFMAPRYDVVNGGVTMKKGWRTDSASKNELISGVREYLIERRGALNARRLVGELMTFVRTKTGKAEAKAGCHDDCVMAFGIALQVDLLAPMDQDLLENARKEEAKTMADWTSAPMVRDDSKPETIEERCFAHAMAKRLEREVREEDLWGQVQGEELSEY